MNTCLDYPYWDEKRSYTLRLIIHIMLQVTGSFALITAFDQSGYVKVLTVVT